MKQALDLKTVSFTKMTHTEAGDFIKKNYDDAMASGLDLTKDPRIQGCLTSLQKNVGEWDGRILISSKSPESELLEALDRARDRVFMALSTQYLVHSYEDDDAVIINAHKALSVIFPMYEGVTRENYASESTSLRSLLVDLKSPANAPHATVLGLDKYVLKLETANEAFGKAFAKRDVKKSADIPLDNKAFRADMFEIYDEYAGHVLSMAKDKTNPNRDFYIRLLEIINYVRKYFSDMLATKAGRKKTK